MKARKRFGQHFLEPAWVTKVMEAIEPASSDTVLEIGPGRGALTLALAPHVRRVIAVEIDRDLVTWLARQVPANVQVVSGDVLDIDMHHLLEGVPGPVRVVGNLPYNVASPILFRLMAVQDAGRVLSDATLMVQREVAARLTARPGTGEYGVLTIHVAMHAQVERRLTLPPGAFRPSPRVTSTVVRLRFHAPAVPREQMSAVERLVRGVFTQRRKTLLNALKPVVQVDAAAIRQDLERLGIDPRRRPETLTLEELAQLATAFSPT
jgi:16S rRNA (adenine1518-N6/adenine1519-N6)-dimethyltransferase